MVPSNGKRFDVLEFVKWAKELGVSEELAEFQARQIAKAIDIAVALAKEEIAALKSANHTTLESELSWEQRAKDLEHKIIKSRYQTIIWVVSLFSISGLIQYFFK